MSTRDDGYGRLVGTLDVAARADAARRARYALGKLLADEPDVNPDRADDAAFLLSEVVTNSATHAASRKHPWMRIIWRRFGAVLLTEVNDPDPSLPTMGDAGVDDDHGRGLFLLEAMADRWTAEPVHPSDPEKSGGKVVWFALQGAFVTDRFQLGHARDDQLNGLDWMLPREKQARSTTNPANPEPSGGEMRSHRPPQAATDHTAATCGSLQPLPQAADLLHAFASDDNLETATQGVLRSVGQQLVRQHLRQWAAEDSCRDPAVDDRSIGAAKRAIDAMNAARIDAVGRIDVWAGAHIPDPQPAPLHTETLGSVVDRLAVAWVRANQLGELARASADPGLRKRAHRALDQLDELGDAYDDLIRELRAGRRRVPSWRPLKHYGGQSQ